jgi:hypothetical protein
VPGGPGHCTQVFGVLFVLLLVIFYLGVCLYRKDMTVRPLFFLSDPKKL